MTVTFHAGACVGQSDDSDVYQWYSSESIHSLIKRALTWAAGNFPESDGSYSAVVWIESDDGDVIATEDVMISPDGEMDFDG